MRLQLVPLLIFILLSAGIDVYIFRQLRSLRHKWIRAAYAIISCLLIVMVIVAMNLPFKDGNNTVLLTAMWMIFTFLSVYLPKCLYVLFSLIARIPALFHRKRVKWLSVTGAVISVIVFVALWWGALINRFNIDVNEVEIVIPGLPDEFDGYRIAQISDLHVGTFGNDTSFTSRLVDCVNSQGADVIVFTGDIVNSVSSELIPHAATLSRLNAADGVYSIFGNHDYGDYSVWPSPEAKSANLMRLDSLQRAMGWKLLKNEHSFIKRGNDSIVMIGVENIGDPPFHTYGCLMSSYPTLNDSVTKILLSHNPAHWINSISENPTVNIPLTLAGHTHAMQIEIAGVSPAVFRYPTWGGLYKSKSTGNQLYVNIGAGTVGMPARIGATPEITILTLKKKQ